MDGSHSSTHCVHIYLLAVVDTSLSFDLLVSTLSMSYRCIILSFFLSFFLSFVPSFLRFGFDSCGLLIVVDVLSLDVSHSLAIHRHTVALRFILNLSLFLHFFTYKAIFSFFLFFFFCLFFSIYIVVILSSISRLTSLTGSKANLLLRRVLTVHLIHDFPLESFVLSSTFTLLA